MKLIITLFSIVIAMTFISQCSGKQENKQNNKTTKTTDTKTTSTPDTQIGLRKYSLNDDNPTPTAANYSKKFPGTSTKIQRSFDNAPPLIPHNTQGLLPITAKNNTCLTCHMPQFAKTMKSTAIPISHLTDSRNIKDLKGKLSQARYVCTTCHVQQATNLKPLVQNNFTAGFASEKMKSSSNLTFSNK